MDRVEMDVDDDADELFLGSDRDTAKGALEEGARPMVIGIEGAGIRIEHVGDALTGGDGGFRSDIELGEAKQQMEVVVKQAVRERLSPRRDMPGVRAPKNRSRS